MGGFLVGAFLVGAVWSGVVRRRGRCPFTEAFSQQRAVEARGKFSLACWLNFRTGLYISERSCSADSAQCVLLEPRFVRTGLAS